MRRPKTKKKATNVTVQIALLEEARARSVNLSAVLEEALIVELKRRKEADWLEENEQAVSEYNERVATDGVFGDGLRRF